MPIQPIDAQILFSQLDQVGKEQAAQKEIPPHAQSLQAAEMARQAEQADRSVNQARQADQGAEKVHDEGEKAGGRKEGGTKKKGRGACGPPAGEAEVFEDPDLGRHVDLIG